MLTEMDPRKAIPQAHALFKAGRLDEAEALLKEVRSEDPWNPQVPIALAMIAARRTGPEAALPLMKHALSLQPDSSATLLWVAILSQQVGDKDAAYEYCLQSVEADPKNAEAQFMAGELSLQRERFQDALGYFNAALATNSTEPTFHRGRSNALSGLSRDGEALAAAKEAVKLLPDEEYLTIQGELEHLVGNVADSAKSSRRALKLNPDCVRAQTNLARALAEMGDPDAEEAWERAVRMAPDSGDLRLNKAQAHAARGEREAGGVAM